ncbi:Hemerythrin HHE cation binding domain protein [Leptothrix cholodnii SP-6]|uniref:Hemerythrin HHE cation binding domain protein n=1 Tax=Leptothrix cholodnii (strain ATCC 51168 / LMG 8142 / SP-6) TaxID=395495 RepID=B1Y1C2_LEPCP|nr:hemerythrin domain-containing protein [Leptothrix cholodnii]ACB33099.1 Hemerythrin HHE cation binding domain protein [Leptothrix cholodnii SP-6]
MSAGQIPAGHEPVQSFADCHTGIVQVLNGLGELPALLASAHKAQAVAGQVDTFFQQVIVLHHREEEDDLFPAVLASATAGEERDEVERLIARLTSEHRQLEASFHRLLPAIEMIRHGALAPLDRADVAGLVREYLAHASFEEAIFLPKAHAILGRNSDHMAALGLSLHIRHASEDVRRRFGSV